MMVFYFINYDNFSPLFIMKYIAILHATALIVRGHQPRIFGDQQPGKHLPVVLSNSEDHAK